MPSMTSLSGDSILALGLTAKRDQPWRTAVRFCQEAMKLISASHTHVRLLPSCMMLSHQCGSAIAQVLST